jgi:hypothetical protein
MASINNISDSDSITIKLKSTYENREHEIVIPSFSTATVDSLRNLTYEKLLLSQSKNIRLIYLGKLLDPPSALLSTFHVKNGAYIHVAVSEKRSTPTTTTSNPNSTVINSPHITINIAPRSALRGLDVLTSYERDESFPNPLFRAGYGLSVNEVAALRSSFRANIDEFLEEHEDEPEYERQPAEDDVSYRLRMESLWLQSLTESSEFYLNLPVNTTAVLAPNAISRLQRLYSLPLSEDGVYENSANSEQQAPGSYHDYVW